MRALVLLVWLAVPTWAIAKPTLALAPIEGDKDGKVAELIEGAVEEDFKVIGPKKVEAAMGKLDIGEVDPKTIKKLRKKLDAEIVVYGQVDKEGKKKNLTLSISARGKRTQKFEIDYKSADAKSFKKELRGELNKRLAGAERDDSNNDDDEDDKPKREDKREASRDDDDKKLRKKRNRDDDDDDRPRKKKRHPINQAALRLAAGGVAARRTLTYDGGGATPPPRVGTFGGAGRIDAEVYPAAFDTLKGAAAGIGFAGEFEKALGVSIDVPGTDKSTPINQMRFSIGARYRVTFGTGSFAFGASYWYRQFVADRSSLGALETLDMPDVKYKAVAPTLVARFAAAPNVGVYFSAEVPLLLDAGPIQSGMNYGPANVIAFDVEGGAQLLVSKNYAVRIAAQFEQVGLSFKKANREVTAAKDRLMGVTATLEVLY
ncbi:MAG: hypothetical protein ACKV2T_00175 [Kofleriaceae bacterium]